MNKKLSHMVVEGNVFDGLTFYGPFKTQEDAIEYAGLEDLVEWTACPMIMPDEESGFGYGNAH